MYKAMFILIIFVTSIFADPPPPWAKDGAKKDTAAMQKKPLPPPFDKAEARYNNDTTVLIIISGDTKEYSVIDKANAKNPAVKIIQEAGILSMEFDTKFKWAAGMLRDTQDNKLIWKVEVPKSLKVEINTSEWPAGKFCGGVSNYHFCVVKE